MTAVRITPAQARRLGIGPPDTGPGEGTRRRQGGGPRARRVPYHTVCHDCGEYFDTEAAETRHLDTTRHAHYQLADERADGVPDGENG